LNTTPRTTPRTAVIFRTHFWDEFAQRQFDRLLAHSQGTDVFVLVDETSGPVAGISHDRVVRVTEQEIIDMGFAAAGSGNLLWFNGDYPLYRFQQLYPAYDYYFQLEYDVVLNGEVSDLVEAAWHEKVDFVGLTKGEATQDWPWLSTCADAYEPSAVEHQLICIALFSARALHHLWQRRLVLSQAYSQGDIKAWPMCEGFIATELAQTDMTCRELSAFGDTSLYDHWPPFLEADLNFLSAHAFIHPLLDEQRYVGSLLKYHVGLPGYLNPTSVFHRKLRRLPPRQYVSALVSTFTDKARRNVRNATTAARRAFAPNDPGKRNLARSVSK
jgi:hypothetical protein